MYVSLSRGGFCVPHNLFDDCPRGDKKQEMEGKGIRLTSLFGCESRGFDVKYALRGRKQPENPRKTGKALFNLSSALPLTGKEESCYGGESRAEIRPQGAGILTTGYRKVEAKE